jgi:hypothetical protein
MTELINEAKRFQELAGISEVKIQSKEDTLKQMGTKKYLLNMIQDFNDGNDNEYPVGEEMEFEYNGIEREDVDNYGEEEVNAFKEAREFLKKNGPITINDRIVASSIARNTIGNKLIGQSIIQIEEGDVLQVRNCSGKDIVLNCFAGGIHRNVRASIIIEQIE